VTLWTWFRVQRNEPDRTNQGHIYMNKEVGLVLPWRLSARHRVFAGEGLKPLDAIAISATTACFPPLLWKTATAATLTHATRKG
jgi:hypothetical protein